MIVIVSQGVTHVLRFAIEESETVPTTVECDGTLCIGECLTLDVERERLRGAYVVHTSVIERGERTAPSALGIVEQELCKSSVGSGLNYISVTEALFGSEQCVGCGCSGQQVP